MKNMKNKKIAVLFGGPSPESEVSYRSGKRIFDTLKQLNYNAEMIEFNNSIAEILKDFDICFNIMHGTPGEDGSVQGMLETIQIPYTGSGVIPSAITINKYFTQKILQSINIPVCKSIYIDKNIIKQNKNIVEESFNSKIIIKPNTGGSSVGTIITEPHKAYEEIINSIYTFKEFIIEEYIENAIELTTGIIEENGKGRVLTPLQLRPKNKFYDYEAKYTKGMTDFIIPPELDNNIIEKIKSMTENIFEKMHLKSFARVDFLVKDNKIYELEINSIPGMTDLSDLPQEAEYDGISYSQLIEKIIHTAGVNKNA